MASAPGREVSTGGIYYYNPLGTIIATTTTENSTNAPIRPLRVYVNDSTPIPLDNSLLGQLPRVNASIKLTSGITNPPNVPDSSFSYFGIYMYFLLIYILLSLLFSSLYFICHVHHHMHTYTYM